MTRLATAPIALLAGLGLSVALWGVYTYYSSHSSTPSHKSNAERAAIALWRKNIAEFGAAAAYQQLLTQELGKSSNTQHGAGHTFGRALYEETGLRDYGVCDDNLFGGCLHEFVSAAIEDYGLGVISKINKACLATFGDFRGITCQHGIGHGLIAYFGYSEDGVRESLKECATIHSRDATKGCYGGVFMEYNQHIMSGGDQRPFFTETTYAPCTNIASEYQHACYFWLPQWWRHALYIDELSTKTYAGLGSLCNALEGMQKTACFTGIGYTLSALVATDSAQTQLLCDTTSKNKVEQNACWSGAAGGTVE